MSTKRYGFVTNTEAQMKRQPKYPPDRIAFWPGDRVAHLDMVDFKEYKDGRISFDELRVRIAKNNYLNEYFPEGMIPENMMRTELRYTGWERKHAVR